jgi:hypothetical protein
MAMEVLWKLLEVVMVWLRAMRRVAATVTDDDDGGEAKAECGVAVDAARRCC